MLAPATIAALSPFFLGLSQTLALEPRISSYDFSANVTMFRRDIFSDLSSTAMSEMIDYPCDKYPDPKPCYEKYYHAKHSCHPLDHSCYRDTHNWDDYKRRCKKPDDKCYDKCHYEKKDCYRYDSCHKSQGDDHEHHENHGHHGHHADHEDHKDHGEVGDHEDNEGHGGERHHRDHGQVGQAGDNGDCYKKHKDYYDRQDHCKPNCSPEDKGCYKCRKECPPEDENCEHDYRPPQYCKPDCKPNDHGCHKCKEPHHKPQHDSECELQKDKNCFPGYPRKRPSWDDGDNDDDDDDDDDDYEYHPHHPKSYITVNYFGPEGTYQEKVWPDGDEHWNGKSNPQHPDPFKPFSYMHDEHYKHFKVDHIKYYAEQEDSEIRCLPMKSWFPWTPLPLEKYVEHTEEYGLVVRILKLKKPIPVELVRCDLP
ncbi:hypothetical protein SLS53_000208 [Cytospora paraplurivora]|uniref:Uncharacterized protein n=1 Tax=Cytospora paraplurivora TaxID=2898453 RepID=A0AAN9YPL7_9PEZI